VRVGRKKTTCRLLLEGKKVEEKAGASPKKTSAHLWWGKDCREHQNPEGFLAEGGQNGVYNFLSIHGVGGSGRKERKKCKKKRKLGAVRECHKRHRLRIERSSAGGGENSDRKTFKEGLTRQKK